MHAVYGSSKYHTFILSSGMAGTAAAAPLRCDYALTVVSGRCASPRAERQFGGSTYTSARD